MFLIFIYSKCININKFKKCWLICERGDEAQDNGYFFYKYLIENHSDINFYYIIRKNSKDFNKVNALKESIDYCSFKHKVIFFVASKYISTHIGQFCPWDYNLFKKLFDKKNMKKFIFLQHGIIHSDLSNVLKKEKSNIDLFITSTYTEYQIVLSYGFNENEVVKTGLARFDNLHDFKEKKHLLFFPTWRRSLQNVSEKEFMNSEYFQKINSFLNNIKLNETLQKNGLTLLFFPHYEMQKYIHLFKNNTKNIEIIELGKSNVQDLLKESKIIITDYSSIAFDVAYMRKKYYLL